MWAPEVILHNSVEERFIYRQVSMIPLIWHSTACVFLLSDWRGPPYIQISHLILAPMTLSLSLTMCFFCQIGVVHHTGHFVYVIAVHSKSACSPNFEGFPWGMQVFWISLTTKFPHNNPDRFAVFNLGPGSTVSMGWSTDCPEIAPLVSLISNRLLVGR